MYQADVVALIINLLTKFLHRNKKYKKKKIDWTMSCYLLIPNAFSLDCLMELNLHEF